MRNKLASVLCVSLLIAGCTNLDENLRSTWTPSNFGKATQEQVAGIAGCYVPLYSWANHGSYFTMQEISTDEAMIPQRGGDWYDGGQPAGYHTHSYTPNFDFVNGLYNQAFGGVATCNAVLPAVASSPLLTAELKVLRAYYYWVLLDNYGSVLLTTEAGKTQGQKSRAEIYAFIDSELTANLPVLKANLPASLNDTYARINYYVGQAIAAKLYLNAKVYTGTAQPDKTIAACDEIINSGKFNLEANYFNIFKAQNKGSVEHIWVIPYDHASGNGFNLDQMTLHYGSQQTYQLQQQPWNGYCSLEDFYNSYAAGDARKTNNFIVGPQYVYGTATQVIDGSAESNDPDGPGLNFTPHVNELAPNALRQAGARLGKYEFAIGSTPNLDNDFPLYRYADILLTKAEALFTKNGYGDATGLALVNQVHQRTGLAPFATMDATTFLAERGREMAFEGWRRNDLIRFGHYGDAWFGKPADPDNHREIYPIPSNAIVAAQAAGIVITQNPGY